MTNTPSAALKAFIIPVTPFQQNCSLVYDEAKKVGAIVDPGGDVLLVGDLRADARVGLDEELVVAHPHPGAGERRAALCACGATASCRRSW